MVHTAQLSFRARFAAMGSNQPAQASSDADLIKLGRELNNHLILTDEAALRLGQLFINPTV